MLLNDANMRILFTGLNAALNKGLQQADTDYLEWCNVVNSGAMIEEYPIMMMTGSMREWVGARVINSISGKKLSVQNRDFEHTEEINRNRIEDDQIGFYNIAFQGMGVQAGNLWAELATEALCSPGNWADGKPFYGSRKFGKATVNNSMGNLPLSIANYEAARARMMGFCGADGKSLRLVPDTILVGPELEGTARMIFEAELVNDGQNAAISNIHRGECKIMVNTGITGPYAKYWFLVNTSRGVKPITVQKRKQGPLVRWDREDSPCVMDHNVNRYGLHYRGAAVASMPHLVIGSFPAAE